MAISNAIKKATQAGDFNKIINIELSSNSDAFKIVTPTKGRKPKITIAGSFASDGQAQTLEVRITNLYTSKDLTKYHTIKITAGYENSSWTSLVGEIGYVYTASPGPEKETVIYCTTADIQNWRAAKVQLQFKAGFSLKDAMQQISKAAGLKSPILIMKGNPTSSYEYPWNFSGTANDALAELHNNYFPGFNFYLDNQTLYATPDREEAKKYATAARKYTIKYLTSSPQLQGSQISFTAPWIPAIKVGDQVVIKSNYFTNSVVNLSGQVSGNTYQVVKIDFNFSTTEAINEMVITGVQI